MEFSLTINQKQIHENFPVLDIKDAAIIDFLTRFSHAKKIKKRIVGTDVYYWFDYGKIASENPLLKLDRESIRKRVRNICKLGILNAHPDNQGGEVYFAFGDNYEKTHRADLPEVEAQTSVKLSRTHRADNPELLAKHRANNPDNHNNHLSVNQDQGERTPPAPNPLTSKEEKKENGLVAPAENPETEESEIPPSKKVAPKKDSPEEECPMCEGKGGWYNRFTEGHETCPACHGEGKIIFEATAIASPTDIPGVTLVEATTKTIQPWEYPNPQSPKELKTILLRYANQNPDNWRDNVLESGRATNWPAEKVDECLTDFCAWQFQQDSTRGKLSQYTAGFSLWLKRQPRFDGPKDGVSQTRGQAGKIQKAKLNGFGADPTKYQETPLF